MISKIKTQLYILPILLFTFSFISCSKQTQIYKDEISFDQKNNDKYKLPKKIKFTIDLEWRQYEIDPDLSKFKIDFEQFNSKGGLVSRQFRVADLHTRGNLQELIEETSTIKDVERKIFDSIILRMLEDMNPELHQFIIDKQRNDQFTSKFEIKYSSPQNISSTNDFVEYITGQRITTDERKRTCAIQ